jgi:hypothetical protein
MAEDPDPQTRAELAAVPNSNGWLKRSRKPFP